MATSDDLPVEYQHRTDWDATFRQTQAGLVDGGVEKRVGHEEMLPDPTRSAFDLGDVLVCVPLPKGDCRWVEFGM